MRGDFSKSLSISAPPVRRRVDNPPKEAPTMQYMLLIYNDPSGWDSMSEAERGEMYQAYGTYTTELQASGKHVAGDALQGLETATSVRVRGGETLTTDG